MEIASPRLEQGGTVPVEFTCDDDDVSPPLDWSGVPDGAADLILLMDDPDAPAGTFVHWVVRGIPPDVEGVGQGKVPRGGTEGENSAGDSSYMGPCPPEGDPPHRYRFTIQALDAEGNVLAGGTLTALYGR